MYMYVKSMRFTLIKDFESGYQQISNSLDITHIRDNPGTESMGKPWKNHGKSMGKIPWIPLKTMEHGAGAKFHGFHGEIPMLFMLAWDSKNCKITPHESMESME